MGSAFDVIVLAGGAGRRFGGVDKPALDLNGRSLLDHVLGGCVAAGARRLVVVGPERPTGYTVTFCRESPPGGGPVAALFAGLWLAETDLLALVAGDMPFVGAALADLVAAVGEHDGAVLVDADGRRQPLAGVYRRRAMVDRLAAIGSDGRGVALRAVVEGLDLAPVPDRGGAAADCDTWGDLEQLRGR